MPTTTHRASTRHDKQSHDEPRQDERSGRGALVFFSEFFRSPKLVGSVWPTSSRVARAMVEGAVTKECSAVAEYGPGTGAITPHILEAIGPVTTFFAIERSERLAEVFRRRFPGVKLFENDAANIGGIMSEMRLAQLDVVVSAIPWLIIPHEAAERILKATVAALKPGGVMTQLTYSLDGLPAARKVQDLMAKHFRDVRVVKRVWRNLPPAFVYHCRT